MSFNLGTIPDHWRRYKVHKTMAVAEWIADFARRLQQLTNIAGLDNLNNVEVWLGGLFFPEAYITASRQAVAHRKRWSLETLHLQLDLERVNDPGAFIVDGTVSTFHSPCLKENANLTFGFQGSFLRVLAGLLIN